MDMTPVSSSQLRAVGYDADSEVLRVEFMSGSVWDYEKVDEASYRQLLMATSQGRFFNQYIRGRYTERRVA